jgi:hypothetical protein
MKKNIIPFFTLAMLFVSIIAQAQTITSFAPSGGSIGSVVTITGTALSNPTAISVGGVSAIVLNSSSTMIQALVMPNATTGTISLTAGGGSVTSDNTFMVLSAHTPDTQQGAKLVGTAAVGNANQAQAVAISADGNTAVVGGFADDSNIGAVWIYTRTAGIWTQQGTKLVGTGAVGTARQGRGVAISADGNTVVSGGYNDNGARGALWVFTRSGSTWTQEGSKIVCTGYTGDTYLGGSVALSADGNTLAASSHYDNGFKGATWVFVRSSGVWAQQGTKLVGTGAVGNAGQGRSVAISADGNTLITGGNQDNSGIGAAWVFTRTSSTWTQEGTKIVGTGNVGISNEGTAVAISADGNTATLSASNDDNYKGACWVFAHSGSFGSGTWAQQGAKLVPTGVASLDYAGVSVAMSADGNTLAVGGTGGTTGAWTFKRTGSTWAQSGTKLLGTGVVAGSGQGQSIAISADANTLLVGGYSDDGFKGAAWIFTHHTPTLFVDANIATSGNGETFASAFKTLDEALVSAWNNSDVTRINVASGNYTPTRKPYNADGSNIITNDVLDNTFHVRGNLGLYGGYDATTGLRTEAPFGSFGGAILNGDINNDDTFTGTAANLSFYNNTENVYHVLLTVASNTTPSVTIDGFTVQNGNGNAGTFISLLSNVIYRNRGAGLLCIKGKQNIKNMTFVHNTNTYAGGGIMVESGINTLQNNIFDNNKATEGGGVVCIGSTDSLLTNTFTENHGSSFGGGARLTNGTSVLTDNIFTSNAGIDGGGFSTNNIVLIATNNTFDSNNSTRYGGGFDVNYGTCIFNHNTMLMNSAPTGGGGDFYAIPTLTVNDNVFEGNSAGGDAGGTVIYNSTATLNNNIFSGNLANGNGGGLYFYNGTNTVFNNTFYGNNAVLAGGGIYTLSGTNAITNSIFYANKRANSPTVASADYAGAGTNGNTFKNNILQFAASSYPISNTGTYAIGSAATGNVFAQNPNFIDATDPNGADDIWRTADDGFLLACNSAAYNTATNTGAPALDILGNAIYNTTKDIGAYEAQSTLVIVPSITGTTTGAGSVSLTATPALGAGGTYVWSSGSTPNTAANTFTTLGTYTVTVTLTNSLSCSSSTTVNVTVTYPCPAFATLYVDANIAASGDGSTFAQAYKTLDEALTVAWNCSIVTRINVASGTYIPTQKPYNNDGTSLVTADARDKTFHVRDGLALYGGYNATTGLRTEAPFGGLGGSILSGDIGTPSVTTDNTYHVLIAKDVTNGTIDGFTITKGRTGSTGTVLTYLSKRNGAGLTTYNANLTLKNNYFTDNIALGLGGGVYIQVGTITFDDNILTNNTAGNGGGATFQSATVSSGKRNIFASNAGNTGSGYGGGLYLFVATGLFENCVFTANNAGAGGGIANAGSTLILKSSTLSNNIGVYAGGLYNEATVDITGVIFEGNTVGGSSTAASSDFFHDTGGSGTFVSTLLQRAISNYTTTGSGDYDLGTSGTNNYGGYSANFVNATDPNGADNIWRTADDGLVLGCGSGAYNRAFTGTMPTTDILGNAVFGSFKDIGAYELQYNPTLPTAGITGTTTACSSVNLTATGGGTYNWSGGTTPTTAANTFSASTTYTVTVTSAAGCTATSTIAVVVNSLPTAGITGTATACTLVSLTATGGTSYVWSGGNSSTTAANMFSVSGDYTVTVTNVSGCTATAVQTVLAVDCNNIYIGTAACNSITIPNVQGNAWFDIFDASGIIASINPNGMNLGDLTISIGDLAAPPTNGTNTFLPRTMDIQCAAYPTGVLPAAYSIKLYYYDSEFDAYKTAISNTTATLADLGIAWSSGGSGCTIAGYTGTSNGLIDKTMVSETDYGLAPPLGVGGLNGFYLAFDLNHFTLFVPTINTGAPLPVRLLTFSGNAKDKTNIVHWTTASEQNADRYAVERSDDGIDFKPIGSVTAKGNSNTTTNYDFTDKYPSNQLTNQPINYYRLKMIDKDGSFEYSNVISLRQKVSAFEVQSIYPNPTASNVNVSFMSETNTLVSFSLYDALGKQISNIVTTSQIGFNLQSITTDDLPGGVYYLSITTNNNDIQTHKIVKM